MKPAVQREFCQALKAMTGADYAIDWPNVATGRSHRIAWSIFLAAFNRGPISQSRAGLSQDVIGKVLA